MVDRRHCLEYKKLTAAEVGFTGSSAMSGQCDIADSTYSVLQDTNADVLSRLKQPPPEALSRHMSRHMSDGTYSVPAYLSVTRAMLAFFQGLVNPPHKVYHIEPLTGGGIADVAGRQTAACYPLTLHLFKNLHAHIWCLP